MRGFACTAALALATAIPLTATACASSTKAGGAVTHPVRIVMQASDGSDTDANSVYFVSQVQKRSGGRIRIVLGNDYPSSDTRNEPRLVRALRRGKVQMAYVPARAWEEASPVTAFRALQAPLLISNYPLLRRITTGPIGRSMLASLNSIGIVGLGLVPQRLRRLLGRRPLDSAKTLRGARIRPVVSQTGELALKALGAVPVTIADVRAAGPALARKQIDGVESETISIEDNGYVSYAHDLTANLALFAKATTIAIRKSVFDRLSTGDRSILRAAAKATVAHADPASAERTDVRELCSQGAKLVTATPGDLASLEPLALSAYRALGRDPTTRHEIGAIDVLRNRLSVSPSNLPACPTQSATQVRSKHVGPVGTYTLSASLAEVRKAAGSHGPADNYGTFRLVLRDGRFRMSDGRPTGVPPSDAVPCTGSRRTCSSGWSAGTYAINGRRIIFTVHHAAGDTPLGRPGDPPVICLWSSYRGALTFQQLFPAARASATARGFDAGGPPALYVKLWRPAHAAPPTQPEVAFPIGTFETKITPADVRRVDGLAWWAHWETLTFEENGTFVDVWFHPRRSDQPTVRARYFVRGNRMYQIYGPGRKDSYSWSYDRGELIFRPLIHPDLDKLGMLNYIAHPWRKIK